MLEIKKITTESGFKELERDWEALLASSKSDTIFLSWDWLYGWWQVFGGGKELMLLTVWDDGRLVGAAPLYLSEMKRLHLFKVRTIGFLGSGGVASDYLDFIIETGREREVSETINVHLHSGAANWHTLYLSSIPEDSANLKYICEPAARMGLKTRLSEKVPCPYIKLPGDWDSYLGSLSKSMRYDIRRKTGKRLKDLGIDFYQVTEEEGLEGSIEKLKRLNRLRMRAKNVSGAFCQKDFSDFHTMIIPRLLKKDKLRLYFLTENGNEIAALYNFRHNRTHLFYQIGYGPERDKLSLGTVLFRYAIEKAIQEGMKEFDFLRGDERYKYKWASDVRNNLVISIYNRGVKSTIAYFADNLRASTKKALKRLATPLGGFRRAALTTRQQA